MMEISTITELLSLRHQFFGNGVMAIDCGANIGAHTIEWAISMTGWGKVEAFEAQERLYYALAGNIAINNCFNARAIYAAIGNPSNHNDFIDVPIPDYTKASSFGSLEIRKNSNNEFIGQSIDYTNTQRVTLLSIDNMKYQRVDLIKIDVEGMELEVLNGAINTIKKYKPILLIEIIKSPKDMINKLLESLDYEIFAMGINILAISKNDPTLEHITQK